jgi:hypothetical protein
MKSFQIVVLFVAVIAISVSMAAALYTSYMVPEIRYIPVKIEVGQKVGLDISTDMPLSFGVTFPTGTSGRDINLTHDHDFPARILFVPGGDIWEWISFTDNNFIMEKGDVRDIKIIITVPEDAQSGTYTGFVGVILKRETGGS